MVGGAFWEISFFSLIIKYTPAKKVSRNQIFYATPPLTFNDKLIFIDYIHHKRVIHWLNHSFSAYLVLVQDSLCILYMIKELL